MKTEIRKGTKALNSITDDRVILFFPEMYGGNNIADVDAEIQDTGKEDLSSALSLPETVNMILSAVANIRRRLRFEGFKALSSTANDSLSAVYFDEGFDNTFIENAQNKTAIHYFEDWYRHFMKGFEAKPSTAASNTLFDRDGKQDDDALASNETDWDDDPVDLVRRWAYIKGVEYSPFMDQLVATGTITNDERKDFRAAAFLLSVDAMEEWINTYIDAMIQSEKALLNIGKARLSSLGRQIFLICLTMMLTYLVLF